MSRDRAFVVLALSVVTIANVVWSEARSFAARDELRTVQVQQCSRGLLDRADDTQGDGDLLIFSGSAADARRKDGNIPTAETYDGVSRRSGVRAQSRTSRLLGADVTVLLERDQSGQPARRARAEARAACEAANPKPSLLDVKLSS